MKKKTKLAAVFVAAAVMTAGASLTAFAAGWEQIGDEWIFTDSSGNRVTDTWRQSGNYYFYLDSNGMMATDRWVDDTYYYEYDNGTIYYINDDRERIGEVTRGDRLPEIAYREIYSL